MKRLDYLLTFIPQDSKIVVDVGTDHAYLPIKAVESGRAKLAYASDISASALAQAQKNLHQHHLEASKSIKLIQSNGLNFLKKLSEPQIDYAVISGLGSKTIHEIIKLPETKIKRYLILSNNEISRLRQWAKEHNFKIEHEDFFNDNHHYYWLILINSQKPHQKINNLEFGDWKKWYQKNLVYQEYLTTLRRRHLNYQSRIKDLSDKKINENYIKRIEKYLKQWNW